LEEVAGSLAHEIKNPLAAIKGLVQLVTESPQSPRTPQRLEVLSREVARMESLVHDGLAVARPMHASTLEATSVELLLREVALAVEPHAIEHRVNVTIEPTSLRAIVDPRAMRAALVNLARNAIDASAPHSSITLRAQPQPRAIEIDVIDHGHGMPREVLDRIGAPFFTTRARGHGLGVLVARSVVERHGGSLQFESESGRGTRAVITVPHREASTEA
jgi:signal transduction histidine kinase